MLLSQVLFIITVILIVIWFKYLLTCQSMLHKARLPSTAWNCLDQNARMLTPTKVINLVAKR